MRQVNPLLARLAAASGDERLVGVTEGILDRQREGTLDADDLRVYADALEEAGLPLLAEKYRARANPAQ
jgi:hypothetical protein